MKQVVKGTFLLPNGVTLAQHAGIMAARHELARKPKVPPAFVRALDRNYKLECTSYPQRIAQLWSESWMEGLYVAALVMDAVGSDLLESMHDLLRHLLEPFRNVFQCYRGRPQSVHTHHIACTFCRAKISPNNNSIMIETRRL